MAAAHRFRFFVVLVFATAVLSCTDTPVGPANAKLPLGIPAAGPLSLHAPEPGRLSAMMAMGADDGATPFNSESSPSAAAVASSNMMLWQNTATGDRSIWMMSGTSYAGAVILRNVPTEWSIAGSGDFNGDGQPDILWQNLTTGDRSIWFMNGSTYASAAILPNVSPQWSIAGVGDFNGDGKPDIVWQNLTTGDRSIWFMNGSSYVSAALLPNVSAAWTIVAVADFNGDGRPDLVWQRPGTGEGSIWFMSGSTWHELFAMLPTVPSAWRIAAAADFTGDGNPDLVWQNVNTGQRSIWVMNGVAYASAVILPTVPIAWSISGVLQAGGALVSNAGPDQDKNTSEATTLDGSASTAPNGAVYTWRQVSGPDVTGGSGLLTGISPTFLAPANVSTLQFDLTVTSGGTTTAPNRVVIFVFEDKLHTFFVSPLGGDGAAGTRLRPFRTIAKAIAVAGAQGLGGDVYVAENGSAGYDETVSLVTGVSLYGGYSSDWLRNSSAHVTYIRPPTRRIGMIGSLVSNLTIDGFTIQTLDANGSGESAFGIVLDRPNVNVVVSNNVILPGAGGASTRNGSPGVAGGDGAPSLDGFPGSPDNCCAPGLGGGLVQGGAYRGGGGGTGGSLTSNFVGHTGESGYGPAGVGGGGAGGNGGAAGNPGRRGGDGEPGAKGADGESGAGGDGLGSFSGTTYVPFDGKDGVSDGQSGTSGGGGGGGGGQVCDFCLAGSGNGAGSGGGAAFGGTRATAGGGGGGSFGILIANAGYRLTLINNTIITASGGAGGAGGTGGAGGKGGTPGNGATASTNEIGAGGNGGRGGDGGHGGHGGGGGGGPSIGVLELGAFVSNKTGNTITPGPGGRGGASAGTPGAPGMSTPTFVVFY